MNALIRMHPLEPYHYNNVDVTCTLWYEWIHKLLEPNTPVRTRKGQLHPLGLHRRHPIVPINSTLRRKAFRKIVQKPKARTQLEKKCKEMQSADCAGHEGKLFASRDILKNYKYL